jgi:hypothetical protein
MHLAILYRRRQQACRRLRGLRNVEIAATAGLPASIDHGRFISGERSIGPG